MALNYKIADKDWTSEELSVLAKAGMLHIGQKNDPASTTLTAPALHGPFQGNADQFGLFSGPGVRPQRFSALARPQSWIRLLGAPQRSEYTNEILEIVTGQTAGGTTNATGFCGNPPGVGQLKTFRDQFNWGDYYVKTDLNAVPLIGQLRNRADVPGEIINAGPKNNPLIPDTLFQLQNTRDQLAYELYRLGVDLERTMEVVSIQGVDGADNSRTGWFNEFEGLDTQVSGTKTDTTGVSVPAAASAVISFNANITGTAAGGDGRTFVEAMSDLFYGLSDRAQDVGLDTNFIILMRKEAFRRATDVWACTYATYRCTDGEAGDPVNRDGMAQQALRVEMLRGQYLLIDGVQVPVMFSEGIPNPATANNTYNTDIYILPIATTDGIPLIRLEYFPMDNEWATRYAGFLDSDSISYLNNGMYIVGKRDTGLCVEYHFAARFRLILETPFLAGRLDDVQYVYQAPTRQAIPGASLYVNGGVSYRLS